VGVVTGKGGCNGGADDDDVMMMMPMIIIIVIIITFTISTGMCDATAAAQHTHQQLQSTAPPHDRCKGREARGVRQIQNTNKVFK
jgi:hypothetical protein